MLLITKRVWKHVRNHKHLTTLIDPDILKNVFYQPNFTERINAINNGVNANGNGGISSMNLYDSYQSLTIIRSHGNLNSNINNNKYNI